jgi:anti-anti-sigma factor
MPDAVNLGRAQFWEPRERVLMLKVHTEKLGELALLHFHGRIVAGAETETFRRAVFSQADASIVVLDLSRVDVVDACGLGTLLELREWTQTNGKEFRLFNPTRQVQEVFAITCLNSVFNISFGEDMLSVASSSRMLPLLADIVLMEEHNQQESIHRKRDECR